MQVILELEKQGYSFWLADERIQFEYRGPGRPDHDTVRPLLEELKARKAEAVNYLQARVEEQRRKALPFPYPINETLGIGEYDPLDIRYVNGKPVLDPGWWKKIRKGVIADGQVN